MIDRLTISGPRNASRRGIATLEFVFALPLILCLAAMIMSWGFFSIARTRIALEARHRVWHERAAPSARQDTKDDNIHYDVRHSPSKPLSVFNALKPRAGEIYGVTETEVVIAPWLRMPPSRTGYTVRSGGAIVSGTWDHGEVKSMSGNGPHLAALADMAVPGADNLGDLTIVGGLPALGGAPAGVGELLDTLSDLFDVMDALHDAWEEIESWWPF